MSTKLQSISITVSYLGGSRGQTGCGSEALTLHAGSTVADAQHIVGQKHPALAPLLAQVRWAVNFEFSALETPLNHGDELALLPPVCGGAAKAWLLDSPLDTSAVIKQVAAPEMGAIVVFVGTVRNHARGKDVVALEYDVYNPMTLRQLERIAADCESAHPQTQAFIAHRFGKLAVGDIAVVIATSAAHRDAAYEANRWTLERLKRDAPIWKKETTGDGQQWVGWGGG